MMARKIIIDTDPGIDDAMAIFYTLHSPELELIGLTSVFGNGYIDVTTTNALKLLEIAGRQDIPVARGAGRPIMSAFTRPADFVHGKDGQGNINLPPPAAGECGRRAFDFIIEQVMAAPGEITLVPIGPLTNIAMAILAEPELERNIKEIVLMGGNAFVPGNATVAAEANIVNDPEAADIVFSSSCPITMCGLDVTEKVIMSPEVLDSIGTIGTPQASHLAAILPFYREFYKAFLVETAIHVHDSTAISYLLKPELFKTVQQPVCVDTGSGAGRGKTWAGRSNSEEAWSDRRDINICIDVDADSVINLEMERLSV